MNYYPQNHILTTLETKKMLKPITAELIYLKNLFLSLCDSWME